MSAERGYLGQERLGHRLKRSIFPERYLSPENIIVHTKEPLTRLEVAAVLRVSEKASQSVEPPYADPRHSGYSVEGAAGIVGKRLTVPLFNLEYPGNAQHGEETGIIQLRSSYGPSLVDQTAVLCFRNGDKPTCCGGCRDMMRVNISHNSLITTLNKDKQVQVWRLKDLLFTVDESKEVGLDTLPPAIATVVEALQPADFERKGYWKYHNLDVDKQGHYEAMMTLNGNTYREGGYGPVDYRTVGPVQQIMSHVMPRIESGEMQFGKRPIDPLAFCLYILGPYKGIIPDVDYKDRNQILELEHHLQKVSGQPDLRLPVAHVVLGENGEKKVYMTDTREWLPYPFHPKILSA